jgi:hypothetical protein
VICTSALRSLGLVALGCTFLASGCSGPQTTRGISTISSGGALLEEKSPLEVVVAPVINASGNADVPAAHLRNAFQQGLVQRRYSPLALEFVDKKVGHASQASYRPGSLDEEAVFQIAIEHWDSSLWEIHSALMVKMQVRMLDARDPTAPALWTARVDRRFDFTRDRERFTTEDAALRHASEEIAAEMLAALPTRSPAPGHSAPAH